MTALVHLTAGLLLWSSCFVVLYGLLSLGCEAGWGPLRGLLLVAWGVHLAALAALLAWQWTVRPAGGARSSHLAPPARLHLAALGVTAVSLAGTVWIGWPVLALPPCAGHGLPAP